MLRVTSDDDISMISHSYNNREQRRDQRKTENLWEPKIPEYTAIQNDRPAYSRTTSEARKRPPLMIIPRITFISSGEVER